MNSQVLERALFNDTEWHFAKYCNGISSRPVCSSSRHPIFLPTYQLFKMFKSCMPVMVLYYDFNLHSYNYWGWPPFMDYFGYWVFLPLCTICWHLLIQFSMGFFVFPYYFIIFLYTFWMWVLCQLSFYSYLSYNLYLKKRYTVHPREKRFRV